MIRDELRGVAFLAAWSLVGCMAPVGAESATQAIVGGTPTANFPGVIAIMKDAEVLCTGALLDTRRVLTAAHCAFDPVSGAQYLGPELRIAIGASTSAATAIGVAEIRAHPGYTHILGTASPNDIAVFNLVSDAPAPAVELHRLPPVVGSQVTLVGFGYDNGAARSGAGTKRQVSVTIARVNATTWSYNFVSGGNCFGDSGGPALIQMGAQLGVVGVATSGVMGDSMCQSGGVFTRIDSFLDFIGVSPAAAVSVVGTVTDSTTGAAIAGASISASGGSAVADAGGSFVLNLALGMHTLTSSAPGYSPASTPCTVTMAGSRCDIRMAAGADPDVGGITAAGSVTDLWTGLPILGAQVSVVGIAAPMGVDPANGNWSAALPVGTHTVTASALGYDPGSVQCTVGAAGPAWCPIALQRSSSMSSVETSGCGVARSGRGWWVLFLLVLVFRPIRRT